MSNPSAFPFFKKELGQAIGGNDISMITDTVPNCLSTCYSTPGCVAFTRPASDDDGVVGQCLLKSGINLGPNSYYNTWHAQPVSAFVPPCPASPPCTCNPAACNCPNPPTCPDDKKWIVFLVLFLLTLGVSIWYFWYRKA